MNTKLATSLLALTVVLSPSLASATDIYNQGSANDLIVGKEPAKSWTGIWVGALGGLSFFHADVDYSQDKFDLDDDDIYVLDKNNGFASIDGLGADGLFGELQVGFDKQINKQLVVGIFGGVNISNAEFNASFRDRGGNGHDDIDVALSTDYEWGSVLGARLGLLKSPDTMFYVGGGWAHAQLGDVTGTIDDAEFSLSGPDLNGWFGEIGMETRIADSNVFLTVAGRYTDYSSQSFTLQDERGVENNDAVVETIEVDPSVLAVMVGLKAKLGGF